MKPKFSDSFYSNPMEISRKKTEKRAKSQYFGFFLSFEQIGLLFFRNYVDFDQAFLIAAKIRMC